MAAGPDSHAVIIDGRRLGSVPPEAETDQFSEARPVVVAGDSSVGTEDRPAGLDIFLEISAMNIAGGAIPAFPAAPVLAHQHQQVAFLQMLECRKTFCGVTGEIGAEPLDDGGGLFVDRMKVGPSDQEDQPLSHARISLQQSARGPSTCGPVDCEENHTGCAAELRAIRCAKSMRSP